MKPIYKRFQGGKFIEVKRLPSLIGHSHKIIKFAFSPDSTRLITLDSNEEIKFWDMGQDWVNQQTPVQLISFKNTFGYVLHDRKKSVFGSK